MNPKQATKLARLLREIGEITQIEPVEIVDELIGIGWDGDGADMITTALEKIID